MSCRAKSSASSDLWDAVDVRKKRKKTVLHKWASSRNTVNGSKMLIIFSTCAV